MTTTATARTDRTTRSAPSALQLEAVRVTYPDGREADGSPRTGFFWSQGPQNRATT